MRARAPGKLLLSGAYSVLEGAVAVGVAVDRYAVADTAGRAERDTEEVRAAIELGLLPRAPWFDAAPLRETTHGSSRKLGLGSSAAVLVASLGAWHGHDAPSEVARGRSALGEWLLPMALAAHRRAQPRGSGVDVALSCLGGVLRCRLDIATRAVRSDRHRLPTGTVLRAFACPTSASTATMLDALDDYRRTAPAGYRRYLQQAAAAAEQAGDAEQIAGFVAALATQFRILGELGAAAGISILEPVVAELGELASREDAAFGPAGAGGGDVAYYAGPRAPSAAFVAQTARRGLRLLELGVAPNGVECVDVDGPPGASP